MGDDQQHDFGGASASSIACWVPVYPLMLKQAGLSRFGAAHDIIQAHTLCALASTILGSIAMIYLPRLYLEIEQGLMAAC